MNTSWTIFIFQRTTYAALCKHERVCGYELVAFIELEKTNQLWLLTKTWILLRACKEAKCTLLKLLLLGVQALGSNSTLLFLLGFYGSKNLFVLFGFSPYFHWESCSLSLVKWVKPVDSTVHMNLGRKLVLLSITQARERIHHLFSLGVFFFSCKMSCADQPVGTVWEPWAVDHGTIVQHCKFIQKSKFFPLIPWLSVSKFVIWNHLSPPIYFLLA